ncbi:MAG: serine--tRNA ligase [Candidatus Altiarchaeota archaeon]
MLEIKFVRENPEKVRENLARRGDKEVLRQFDELLAADEEWRKTQAEVNELRQSRNTLSAEINQEKKKGKDVSTLLKKAKDLPGQIKEKEKAISDLREKADKLLLRIPNLLHETVPSGVGEEDNTELRIWGEKKKFGFKLKSHQELALSLGVVDFERAVKISGAGFYFLKGDLALMDLSLQRLAVDILVQKGYTLIEPPLMMRRSPYEGVTDLADFENVMYKIQDDDQYLIATSEHPMAAMHGKEIFETNELPLKYCGISPCFRREIGKHGVDERGLFRVHQFDKIEQFIFSKPDDSWKFHEELLANAEDLIKKLEVPYKVVNVCTGDIGTVAAKKYDIEGWSPREEKYIELMSCSNCTSYQATRLSIKVRAGQEKEYVHTLNSTMVATSRMLRLIIENYQTKEGQVEIPKALQPYMGGQKKIV